MERMIGSISAGVEGGRGAVRSQVLEDASDVYSLRGPSVLLSLGQKDLS